MSKNLVLTLARAKNNGIREGIDAALVVRGEWIELHEENGHEVGTCSHCRHVRIVDNYCPNCGALMDGGNDDENFSSLRRIAGGDD